MRKLNVAEFDAVSGGMFAGDAGFARVYFINGPDDNAGSDGRCGNEGRESCAPNAGDVVSGVVGIAVGAATAEMGIPGLLVSGAAAYAAGKMPVDPNANNSAAYYRVPNKL